MVMADPDFVPLLMSDSEQLQHYQTELLHRLAGELRVDSRHGGRDDKASVKLPLELWPQAFEPLLLPRSLVTVGKEIVARWTGPPSAFDGFFEPPKPAGMEWCEPAGHEAWWRREVTCNDGCRHVFVSNDITLSYCFGTQILRISGRHDVVNDVFP